MTCPTCGVEMHPAGAGNYWCPRCGTFGDERTALIPRLVELCRRYEAAVFPDGVGVSLWGRFGIAGAIRREG